MKKVTLLIALAALVMLAGCKKENDTKGVTLKASIEQNKGNGRTSLNPADGAISWTAGDKILVNNGSSNAIFTLTGGAGTTEGTFTYNGEYEFGTDNVAVYPETATINGNTVSFTLPEEQAFTAAGTFGNGANPMLGIFSDSEDLTFTSLCGGLGISLTGDNIDITGIEIVSANENDKLNGTFECTVDEPTLVAALDNAGTNRIMLNCATTLTADPQEFYIVLPVGTLAGGFTLNVYYGDEEPIFAKSTESTELVVALNTVKKMNTLEVTAVPEGAINGLFSINVNGDQVYFSKGNLQYQASSNTWRFAENQWDYVGTQNPYLGSAGGTVSGSDNAFISQDYGGWIDLFGWGTSGYNHGAVCYQPWSTSNTQSDYYAYGYWEYYLYDQTGQADWGYNAISNGCNEENRGWRTLTAEEWDYLFNTRTTANDSRYARAKVNGVDGVILLPDAWDTSVYPLNNINGSNYTSNTITGDDWLDVLEPNGAVFLPVTGWRMESNVMGVQNYSIAQGCYQSASFVDSTYVRWMLFGKSSISTLTNSYGRAHAASVRLVLNVE